MREIVLDTETTGLDPAQGHRLVEIAAVELQGGLQTGETFHVYVDPQRDVPDEAFRIHGLSTEFLSKQPRFSEVANRLLEFLSDSPLVIHNAEFDVKFLNAEFELAGRSRLSGERVIDTLALARRRHPGASNSLDALCARYKIDASRRIKHGALLDAQLLAEVYSELIGGRQSAFNLPQIRERPVEIFVPQQVLRHFRPTNLAAEPQEVAEHERFVDTIGPSALWRLYAAPEQASERP